MMDRMQAAEQLRKAFQMLAGSLNDTQALEVPAVFDPWQIGRRYTVGDYLTYGVNGVGDPQLYKVVQEHTAQGDWMPTAAASLYVPIGLDDVGYPVWSQPAGAHDAYATGDIVSYNGALYQSLLDGNTYSPQDYPDGWVIFEEV